MRTQTRGGLARAPSLRCLIGALGATALCDRGTATGEGNDTVTTAENLIGSPSADTLVGNLVANRLEGRAGNDNISARAGDDTLAGGPGADRCDGGTGAETTPGANPNRHPLAAYAAPIRRGASL